MITDKDQVLMDTLTSLATHVAKLEGLTKLIEDMAVKLKEIDHNTNIATNEVTSIKSKFSTFALCMGLFCNIIMGSGWIIINGIEKRLDKLESMIVNK